jgi:hypothetical protein
MKTNSTKLTDSTIFPAPEISSHTKEYWRKIIDGERLIRQQIQDRLEQFDWEDLPALCQDIWRDLDVGFHPTRPEAAQAEREAAAEAAWERREGR